MPSRGFSCLFDDCPCVELLFKLSLLNWSVFGITSLFLVCIWYIFLFDNSEDPEVEVLIKCLSFALGGIKSISVPLFPSRKGPVNPLPPLIGVELICSLPNELPILLIGRVKRGCTACVKGALKPTVWGLFLESLAPYCLGSWLDEFTCVEDELIFGEPRGFKDVTNRKIARKKETSWNYIHCTSFGAFAVASYEFTHTGARIHVIFESNFCINMYDDKCFKCDHFNKKCSAVFSFRTFYDDEEERKTRKRMTFRDDTTGNPAKRHLRKEQINSVFYPDLGGASDCMKQIFNQSEALPRSR